MGNNFSAMSPSQSDGMNYVRVMKIKGTNGEEKTLQFPMKLDLERPKRPRTTFNDQQLSELEKAFRTNGYLTGEARKELADRLGLSDTQVKVWFQNRRTKNRRKTDIQTSSLPSQTPISLPSPNLIVPEKLTLMPHFHQFVPIYPNFGLYAFHQ